MARREDINKKVEENFDEELRSFAELVGINSVGAPADGDMPFGRGVQEAFEYVLDKGSEFGYETENIDNYGGHVECGGLLRDESGTVTGTSDEVVGIIAHLDTVPLGDGWKHEPLSCEEEDGKIYGRGTSDDKAGAIAGLFAMKALTDLGYDPSKKVRLILGLDEETGWSGMEYYNERVKEPDTGWTPDANFPAIRAEKGTLSFDIAKKFAPSANEGLELRKVTGGRAHNMVPDAARAVVYSKDPGAYDAVKEKAAEMREGGEARIFTKPAGKSLEITTEGVTAHGATPEEGVNAISILMSFLGTLEFVNDDAADVVEFYNTYIGNELDGASLGCRFEDEDSGATIVNAGMIAMDMKELKLTINVRYPVTKTDEDIYEGIMPVLEKYDMGIVKQSHLEPIIFAEDDPLIKTLMSVYAEETGDTESRPLVIGGGTYARAFNNIVAFGPLFPGETAVCHQTDEYMRRDSLLMMTKIFAQAIDHLAAED